jgi:NAD(P)-dependent dehydrogenase (short-subunit alcohol dehydrogenase family)
MPYREDLSMDSDQKAALVTGANRGIGLEIARELAQKGYRVIGTSRKPEAGQAAAVTLAEEGLKVRFEVMDVADSTSVQSLAKKLKDEGVDVDILVNNAGVALDQWQSALKLDPNLVRQTMEVNFIGALNCCQAFIPAMKERGFGRVVNLSSQMGSLENMTGFLLAYRASKTALNALTRCLADELKETPDLLVNSMCPGWVRTDMGGEDAAKSVEEGADTAIWLATLPTGGPSGGFFQDRKPHPF